METIKNCNGPNYDSSAHLSNCCQYFQITEESWNHKNNKYLVLDSVGHLISYIGAELPTYGTQVKYLEDNSNTLSQIVNEYFS